MSLVQYSWLIPPLLALYVLITNIVLINLLSKLAACLDCSTAHSDIGVL
jgi:hypothetical protein